MRLVDTDILIDHFHRHEAAENFLSSLSETDEQLAVLVITVTELLGGMRSGEEARTEQFMKHYPMTDIVVNVPYERGR